MCIWHHRRCTKISSIRKLANARVRNFYAYENFCDYSSKLFIFVTSRWRRNFMKNSSFTEMALQFRPRSMSENGGLATAKQYNEKVLQAHCPQYPWRNLSSNHTSAIGPQLDPGHVSAFGPHQQGAECEPLESLCVHVSQWIKVPDEWQPQQAIPTILQS